MDLSVLTEFTVPIIVGVCLCVGYILKNVVTTDKVNKYIPLIMGMLGLVLNIWVNKGAFTPEILFGGLFSGLASTGLYEAFRNIIEKKEN